MFPRMTVHDNLLVSGNLQPQGEALHAAVERMFGVFPELQERGARWRG